MPARVNRPDGPRFGPKLRALRRHHGLSQAELATRLGVSASYLNLIENDRRPLPAPMLIRLAQHFEIDLGTFASDEDARLVADLMEAFADPLFDAHPLSSTDVREMATASPAGARAVLALYRAYQEARGSIETLATRVSRDADDAAGSEFQLPNEQVNDVVQSHMNHFPELEAAAETVWREGGLEHDDLYGGLVRYLDRKLGVTVRIARWGAEPGIVRRFDRKSRELVLSELLPTRSRSFQLAHQIALLTEGATLDRLASDPRLSSDEARALGRVTLANYFAAAVLMPYVPFFAAARECRYDLDVIGRRFRVGFEQVCHRLTTLRRPGAEGVPFHMIRIDVAGNISKRFSASGIRFARFSGACPRWNVFSAFMTPGMIRIQLSRMPDGVVYFCLARTLQKDSGGWHSPQAVQAIGLGCQLTYARHLVYSDGVDLENEETPETVGVTCRTCERTDCQQRAFPSLKHPLRIDEDVRGPSIFTRLRPRA